ncbi:MAG: hypothetical protein EAZ27_12285 [Cytophagales bacterium]|nr:MAG: hypothetical protein EAZ27_12285 [Cytophagales bacterium]
MIEAQKSTISQKNEKRFKKGEKSKEIKENASGDESVYKNYNNKAPIYDPNKKVKKIDVTQQKIKQKSIENSSNQGDVINNEKFGVNSKSYLNPVPAADKPLIPKESRKKKTKELKANSEGDINSIEKFGVNSPTYLNPVDQGGRPADPKLLRKRKASELKANSEGDINSNEKFGVNSPTYLNPVDQGGRPADPKLLRKRKASELKANSEGDINSSEKFGVNSPTYLNPVEQGGPDIDPKYVRKKRAAEMKENATGDLDVKQKRKLNLTQGLKVFELNDKYPELRRKNGREAASSGGDVEEIYQIRQYIEEYMSRLQSQESGLVDADVLKKLKKHRESYDKEMFNNSGDVNGTSRVKLDLEKSKSSISSSFSGKTNVDLKARNKKIKDDSHILATNTGDILLKSIKSKENDNRAKTKRATSFMGDFIVSRARKGSHPSSVYLSGNSEKSIKDKEKLRKKYLRKSRKNQGIEDPSYMKKDIQKPKFNEEEYKIWEVRGRGVAPPEESK